MRNIKILKDSSQLFLEVLGLNLSRKGQATTDVKQAFPNTLVQRRGKERNTVYVNLARKGISFSPSSESDAPTVESSSINNLKKLIASISSELDAVTKRIECQLEADEIEGCYFCYIGKATELTV